MKDFIYELYQNDNFTLWLTVALIILVILFVIVFFFGKKDEKLEETKRLQKIELEAFKNEEQTPAPVEVKKEEEPVVDVSKEVINEEVNVTTFKPDLNVEEEEVELPKEEVKFKTEKPLFKDVDEEESPISVNDLPSLNTKDKDKELTDNLTNISAIKEEFNNIELPKEEEKPIFKPSPQIFSSVFVNKNEEEVVTKLEEKEEKPEPTTKTFIIEDEDEEIELPTLKIEDEKEENTSSLGEVKGEVYELK